MCSMFGVYVCVSDMCGVCECGMCSLRVCMVFGVCDMCRMHSFYVCAMWCECVEYVSCVCLCGMFDVYGVVVMCAVSVVCVCDIFGVCVWYVGCVWCMCACEECGVCMCGMREFCVRVNDFSIYVYSHEFAQS